ncbi:MAG: hydantoinase/oxoprolinase family protein [Pseudomonadota bacterium]
MGSISVGIDIGGTFTDVVAYDHSNGTQVNAKVLTTYDDPARAVVDGIKTLLDAGDFSAGSVSRVVHATTLFTNALIERKGALTGLITTAGFEDTLEIGRERKYTLYDLNIAKTAPLVARDMRIGVEERTAVDGSVVTPLDEAGVRAAADRLVEAGAKSIAVVFLHAYANPDHEARATALVRAGYPDVAVSASHEVAPEIREFERASTVAANAYVKPLAESYLGSLSEKIVELGISAPLHLMISSGGLASPAEAKRTPVQMLESGPAAGALAAAFFGEQDGRGNVLAFDMGGTTAKLSLIEDGRPLAAYSFEAARQERFAEGSGLPIRISTIELIEIGAGGGSIAAVDRLGLLKVGPRSAGSEPGPVAYGRGGVEPTVTDANFVLGYLNPATFAGGKVPVDADAARSALVRLATGAGLAVERAAWGIYDVVNENMASAARVHIAERGRDPRDFALLCTGGGGPLHAYYVAKKLGLRTIICPASAGVASALGLLVAPGRVDKVATVDVRLDDCDLEALERTFKDLERAAAATIAETGLDPAGITFERKSDGRFFGQGFELVAPLPQGPYDSTRRSEIADAFRAEYRRKFSRTPPDIAIDFINVRVSATAPAPGDRISLEWAGVGGDLASREQRPVFFPETDGFIQAPAYARETLPVGCTLDGPALIEEAGSTLIVGPGAKATVAANGNITVDMPE